MSMIKNHSAIVAAPRIPATIPQLSTLGISAAGAETGGALLVLIQTAIKAPFRANDGPVHSTTTAWQISSATETDPSTVAIPTSTSILSIKDRRIILTPRLILLAFS